MLTILVTGHLGFIGQNLCHHLKQLGHQVLGYDYHPDTFPELDQVDYVMHLGAISQTTFQDVDQILKQNTDFSIRLFHACQKRNIPLQYASSASVYGTLNQFDESGPIQPLSPYAWSKYLFDRYIQQHTLSAPVQGFRYFNVYGPHEQHKGTQASPITQFSHQAHHQGVIRVFEGSDDFLRDFVSIYDVCRVHTTMMSHPISGLFNVGTGQATSFMSVAQSIAQRFQSAIEVIPMPEQLKHQYQTFTCANLTRLNQYHSFDWIPVLNYINIMNDNLTLNQEKICN